MLDDVRHRLRPVESGWIVGGTIRDALLGMSVTDVDLAVPEDAAGTAIRLARDTRASRFPLSSKFGSWRVSGGTLPFHVDITPIQGSGIDDDLSRRDFTINAMAVDLKSGTLRDPYHGARDVHQRTLCVVGPDALSRDPVRVLRAARLATRYTLKLDGDTRRHARVAATRIWDCPGERLRDELLTMAADPHADRAFVLLDDLGGLGVLIPQLEAARGMPQNAYHHKDVLGHTLEVVQHGCAISADPSGVFGAQGPWISRNLAQPVADGVTRRETLILGCLLHDMAKPETRAETPEGQVTFFHHDRIGAADAGRLMSALRFSRRLNDAVQVAVRQHLVLGFLVHRQPLSLRQIDRYLRAVNPVPVESLVLSAADRLATDGPRTTPSQINRHLRLAREVAAAAQWLEENPPDPPVLRGDEIAAVVGRSPGPWLSDAVEALREKQLMRRGMTRVYAERFLRTWAMTKVPLGQDD